MTERTFRLPDIGEGIAEAELGEWLIKVGDVVKEDDIVCEVTTDKATVEIPSPYNGTITWIGGATGDVMAIGSELMRIETDDAVAAQDPAPVEAAKPPDETPDPEPSRQPKSDASPPPTRGAVSVTSQAQVQTRGPTGRPLASPAVRGRARDMGIDLRQLRGTGPAGRIRHEDLDAFASSGADSVRSGRAARPQTHEVRVVGIRRAIAERMALSKSRIPHFTIIEEIDVDALEELRATLNARFAPDRGKLTVLPFVVQALSEAIRDHPEVNAVYDDDAGVVTRHDALHCGIATQTDTGLMVPVLRHAEAGNLWENAQEIKRLSDAARERRATPQELRGSTMSITSLGPLGALATTPVINYPEVAIIGINKISVRPLWNGSDFVPRRMMNLSCSFDHRVVDGWNAAEFMATLKTLLETPAMLFMELSG